RSKADGSSPGAARAIRRVARRPRCLRGPLGPRAARAGRNAVRESPGGLASEDPLEQPSRGSRRREARGGVGRALPFESLPVVGQLPREKDLTAQRPVPFAAA